MPAKPPCRDSRGTEGNNLFPPMRIFLPEIYVRWERGYFKKTDPKAVGMGGGGGGEKKNCNNKRRPNLRLKWHADENVNTRDDIQSPCPAHRSMFLSSNGNNLCTIYR